jgi:uncharacterized protein with GYD domain
MARRGRKALSVRKARTTETKDDQVAYFYLIKHTEKGVQQNARAKEQGQDQVARAVDAEGGKCSLYSTRGAPFDYVSIMTGLSPSAAVRIAGAIESRGTVRATLIVGTHLKGSISA